jgi:hypothetical protein
MKLLLLLLFCLPLSAQITVGGEYQFSATCSYKSSTGATSTEPCGTGIVDSNGDLIAWASSVPTIATITPAGLLVGLKAGTTNVVASKGTIESNVVAVSVTTPVTLKSVSISSKQGATLKVGATSQIEVTCVYSSGSRVNCNTKNAEGNIVTEWHMNAVSPSVAHINSAGMLTAEAVGKVAITASVGTTTSNSITVTVSK